MSGMAASLSGCIPSSPMCCGVIWMMTPCKPWYRCMTAPPGAPHK